MEPEGRRWVVIWAWSSDGVAEREQRVSGGETRSTESSVCAIVFCAEALVVAGTFGAVGNSCKPARSPAIAEAYSATPFAAAMNLDENHGSREAADTRCASRRARCLCSRSVLKTPSYGSVCECPDSSLSASPSVPWKWSTFTFKIRHRSSLTSLWPPNKEEPARVCGTSPPLDNVHYVKLLPRFLLLCLHRVRRDRAPYRKRLAQRAELLDVRDRLTGR